MPFPIDDVDVITGYEEFCETERQSLKQNVEAL